MKTNIFHFRLDQASSLLVDNGDTVTARAPGYLTQLNTEPVLYLGKLFLLTTFSKLPSIL